MTRLKPMSEKQIQNQILSWLYSQRILAWENQSTGIYSEKRKCFLLKKGVHRKIGVSDILGIFNGKFLAIEVKSAKGKPTEHQKRFLDEVLEHGGIAFIARSIEDVEAGLGKVG